jgi:hypothetical protein
MTISDLKNYLTGSSRLPDVFTKKARPTVEARSEPVKKHFYNQPTQNQERLVQLASLRSQRSESSASTPPITPTTPGRPAARPSLASKKLGELAKAQKQEKFKWRPEQQFNICADEGDYIIKAGAKVHRNERKIPLENCFNMADLPKSKALNSLDLNSRLTLHGHGDTGAFCSVDANGKVVESSAWKLGKFLHDSGLKEVGVLKIKACNIGEKQFLEKLVLSLNHHGVKVGYVSAPVGTYADIRIPMKIMGKRFNFMPIPGFPKVVSGGKLWLVKPEKYALKTVKGNVDGLEFNKTRYSPTTSYFNSPVIDMKLKNMR